jgi:hypothetical protein
MAENATPTPGEYKADVGSGAQLEYGDANELNQSLVAGDADEMFTPGNEDEEILFGPTEGLGRTGPPLAKKPVPNSVLRALPLLSTIANDPKTPPVIKNAYKLILQRLAAEQKAKY